jgi:hypothetical protein
MHDDNGALWKLLTNHPVLKSFAGDGKCLGAPDHAANIEGLAAKDGMLYFGFREPAGAPPRSPLDARSANRPAATNTFGRRLSPSPGHEFTRSHCSGKGWSDCGFTRTMSSRGLELPQGFGRNAVRRTALLRQASGVRSLEIWPKWLISRELWRLTLRRGNSLRRPEELQIRSRSQDEEPLVIGGHLSKRPVINPLLNRNWALRRVTAT